MANEDFRLKFVDETRKGEDKSSSQSQRTKTTPSAAQLSSKNITGAKLSPKGDKGSSIDLSSSIATQALLASNLSNIDVVNNSDIFTELASSDYKMSDVRNSIPVNESSSFSYSEIKDTSSSSSLSVNNVDYFDSNVLSKIENTADNIISAATALAYSTLKEGIENLSSAPLVSYGDMRSTEELSGSRTSSSLSGVDGNSPSSGSSGAANSYEPIMQTVDEAVQSALDQDSYVDYSSRVKVKNSGDSIGNVSYSDVNYDPVQFDEAAQPTKYEEMVYPDAMSNMYDVYFRLIERDGEKDRPLTSGSGVLDTLLSSRLLSARISSIKVPSRVRESTAVSFSGNSYDRVTDVVNDPGKSSFTIRGDTRLYYVDIMNELSGTPLGSLFGKGSAILNALSDSALVEMNKAMKEEIAKLEEDMNESMKKIESQYLDEQAKIYVKALSDTAYRMGGTDELEKAKAAYNKAKEDPSSFAAVIRETAERNSESYVAQLKTAQKSQVEQAKKEAASIFASKNAARTAKNNAQKKINEIEDVMREAHKKEKELGKKIAEQVKAVKKEQKVAEKEAASRARKAAESIKRTDSGEALAYVTSALSRNILPVVKPASSIDDLRNLQRIDIIIKRCSPGPRFTTKLTEKKDERIVFEDVRLLGTSDAISFERENASTQDFTYDFIYKRCYKTDLYDTTGQWVSSQVQQFVNRVIDDATGAIIDTLREDNWENLTLTDNFGKSKDELVNALDNRRQQFTDKSLNGISSSWDSFTSSVKSIW